MKNRVQMATGAFGILLLSACGSGASLTGGAFEGKWTGKGDCQAVQEKDGDRTTDQGQLPFDFEFDSNGSLVMELGGESRTFDSEGASFNFKDSDGLLTTVTVTRRAVSDTEVEYVIDSIADQTQADSNSNFSVHSEQQTSLKLVKDASTGKSALTFSSTSRDTNSFSSEFGSSLTQTNTEVSCSGELALK
jgi:hypothetical protein